MARKLFPYLILASLLTWLVPEGVQFGLVSPGFALEKVKLGTSVRLGFSFYSPVLTAERQGFWKENGLEVEWVPFEGAALMMRSAAAGEIPIGLVGSETPMRAAERGVPVTIVMEYVSDYPYYVWVRTDSPYRHPRELKGARLGVTTLGGSTHAFARVVVKSNGIEKEVRFVGSGGIGPSVAGLRVGSWAAVFMPLSSFVRLKIEGIARQIGAVDDYLPKPWLHTVVFARKDFARSQSDQVKKVLRATLQATDFMAKNSRATIDLMKSFQRYSEEEAQLVYKEIKFNPTGKIDRKGAENARKLFIEYGLLTEKAPALDELFTNEYIPS